jgi:hypothetical protein
MENFNIYNAKSNIGNISIEEAQLHVSRLFEFRKLIKNYIENNDLKDTDSAKKFLNVIDEELANSNRKIEGLEIMLNK